MRGGGARECGAAGDAGGRVERHDEDPRASLVGRRRRAPRHQVVRRPGHRLLEPPEHLDRVGRVDVERVPVGRGGIGQLTGADDWRHHERALGAQRSELVDQWPGSRHGRVGEDHAPSRQQRPGPWRARCLTTVAVARSGAPASMDGRYRPPPRSRRHSFCPDFWPRGRTLRRWRSQVVSVTCPDGGVGYGTCREAAAAVVGGA